MSETLRLAEFVSDTGYEDLPTSVVEATRVYILDNLASGFVGSATQWADMVGELAQEAAPHGPCSIFARSWTTSPSYAALVNGTMIGGFETDHAFVQGSCHPSASAFPAALAIAERDHLNGRSLLTSVALGYEVACRVGMAATRAVEDAAGFHGPGTNAPFGGAAGAGKAMSLDTGKLVNALGIAGSHCGGLMEFAREGAMTKRIHVGRGAQMGLESALLASKGFTGPSTVLEGDRGFLKVYAPSSQTEHLVDGLGHSYLLLWMTVKAYACHASFHSVIEGICRFRSENRCEPDWIERVQVAGTQRVVERHGQRDPKTVLGAQYSLPFSVAVALCNDITDPFVYSEETLWDTRVRELTSSVDLVMDSERFGAPGGPAAEVSLTISGSTHSFTVSDWKGAPTDPCTYDEMASKFKRYALSLSRRYSGGQAGSGSGTSDGPGDGGPREGVIEEIVHLVRQLEELDDVALLARLLRAS